MGLKSLALICVVVCSTVQHALCIGGFLRASKPPSSIVLNRAPPAACVDKEALSWTVKNGHIFLNDEPFYIKGVNWPGLETKAAALDFVGDIDMDTVMLGLRQAGVNAVRIPLCLVMALQDNREAWNSLSKAINKAGEQGILVLLSMDELDPSKESTGSWVGEGFTEIDFYHGWERVLRVFANRWNVFGVEILSEPKPPISWSGDDAVSWPKFIDDFLIYITANVPEYKGLFFVDGIDGQGKV